MADKHCTLSLRGSEAGAVWSDRLAPVLEALAPREAWAVERASEVEFEGGQWVARLARPMRGLAVGMEIARSPVREECIAAEVAWLSRRSYEETLDPPARGSVNAPAVVAWPPPVVAGPLVVHDTLLRSLWTLGEEWTREALEAGTLRPIGHDQNGNRV